MFAAWRPADKRGHIRTGLDSIGFPEQETSLESQCTCHIRTSPPDDRTILILPWALPHAIMCWNLLHSSTTPS